MTVFLWMSNTELILPLFLLLFLSFFKEGVNHFKIKYLQLLCGSSSSRFCLWWNAALSIFTKWISFFQALETTLTILERKVLLCCAFNFPWKKLLNSWCCCCGVVFVGNQTKSIFNASLSSEQKLYWIFEMISNTHYVKYFTLFIVC